MQITLPSDLPQIPLFHIVDEDDIILLNSPDAEWFKILYNFPWQEYRIFGAQYYDALYEFNIREKQKRQDRNNKQTDKVVETKDEAKTRLLFDRPTMNDKHEETSILLFQNELGEPKPLEVRPDSISPGIVPLRLGGKKPKCFFAMLKSFLGAPMIGFASEPEKVYLLLTSNPSFVRACGFVPKNANDDYCHKHTPSLRKLEQFDQIMTEWGIWNRIKLNAVKNNIKSGVIKKENELVGDTTHYHAYSIFETIKYKDDKDKEQKKSQSKVTKNCRCEDRNKCGHEWQSADEGAGTITKSNYKMYWGHKASIIGYPRQGIPLDAVAISDAATFDGKTIYPHLEKLFEELPEIKSIAKKFLYDSAADDKVLKRKIKVDFGIELKASLNPRRKKEITDNLSRGVKKITPYGVPICFADYEMDYIGMRYENEKFIYQAPLDSDGFPVCLTCDKKNNCSPNSQTGRTINISFDLLPHIDPDDPPLAKRYKAIMKRRPSVERMIKRLKCDLGDDRLSKRGNDSFQAYLDKTMIAFHILLQN
ncbi:MAG: hypothetical protein GY714_21545 [Desulfobacterales bacterium]|nr:hypothetical protein [Desulfobacterales bacterium]